MPTFTAGEDTPTTWGVFLLPVPFVAWFNDSVLSALAQLSIPGNWAEADETILKQALQYANEMQARFKLLNFNPFPVGMIFPFGGDAQPAGYLLCDGSLYSGTDYPELFAQLGYRFGGSGSDFNVPNLLNRVVVGSGDTYTLADVGGEATVTLSTAEMPSHSHADAGHTHTVATVVGLPAQAGVGFSANQTIPIIPSNTGIGFANLTNTGGSGAHENMQPFQAITYIIYAGRENA